MLRIFAFSFVVVPLYLVPLHPVQALAFEDARHLLARTGFGAVAPAEIEALRPLSWEQAVDRLIAGIRTEAVTPVPPEVLELPPPPKARQAMSDVDKRALDKVRSRRRQLARAWWFEEMLTTPSPLTERLVMFWHNHFVSEMEVVNWPNYMVVQNRLLRRHAAGNFAAMAAAVAKDPAMLFYLDGDKNRVGKPNENFARELLELFTLGEGHGYTEADIREAARAFTGWGVDQETGAFTVRPRQHDNGVKRFLGETGNLDGDAVVRIVLKRPRVAEFIAAKLWRDLVDDRPDDATVVTLAKTFRDAGYEIRPLLRAILLHPRFRAPETRGARIKSPVELAVGALRLTGLRPDAMEWLEARTRQMGQDLMDPPSVKGWPGGPAWITAATLPARQDFLARLARDAELEARGGTPRDLKDKKMSSAGPTPADPVTALGGSVEAMARLLLPLPPAAPPPARQGGHAVLRALLLDPSFQLM